MTEPNIRDVEEFIKKHGRAGELLIGELGKLAGFREAINSDIGKQLIKDDISQLNELFRKIYTEEANDNDKAEFRVVKKRLERISQRFANYEKLCQKITGESR